MATTTDRNRLGGETSPYLLQHKDNPVHWQPWNAETLAAAKGADKPILLSVGYAACHWCHVMAHESFENPEIAALMNERFVNIKVDREERPDLDAIYQNALALMGEQGGWPLTMFLTPAGEPFWGGTYFPPEPRWGRPGFAQVLSSLAAAYRDKREDVAKNVAALREGLQRAGRPQPGGGGIAPGLFDRIAERLLREVDPLNGGIGTAPKFPQCGIFELLWRAWKRTRRDPYKEAVTRTLTTISQGGIYDHVGGGYARYATDTHWLVPHFEKMLYDNAELVSLLTLVWQDTRDPLYAQRVAETIGWLEREMTDPDGGFYASLDADSEHEEGKFYVWSEAEVDRVLGSRAALFRRFYDVSEEGNWEGHNILNRLAHPALAGDAAEAELALCRELLLTARAARVRPGLDDKILADWNGLAIAALAEAGLAFDRPDWIALAERAFSFVRDRMTGSDGRLRHAWRGEARHPASLDDYADLCRAALALHEATGDPARLAEARGWVEVLDRHYWDAAEGGYFFAADDTADLIARVKSAADAAVPAGNGTMVGVLTRLALLTGDNAYRQRAEQIPAAFSGELGRNFFPLATLINNAETALKPLQIVLAGTRDDTGFAELWRTVYRVSLPNRVVLTVGPGEDLPAGHPAHGKGLVGGKPAAYVCDGPVCSLPLTDPQSLLDHLAALR